MTLQDILTISKLDPADFCLVRHNLTHKVVRECWSDKTLDIYQSIQSKNRFSRVKYVLSFLGEEGTSSRFLGCYRVQGQEPLDPERLPENIRKDLGNPEVLVWWNLEKTDLLTEYDRRLVIDWGKGAINWFQYGTTTKEVLAIDPKVTKYTFEGYDKVCLPYETLMEIITHPKEHARWKKELSRIKAVYVIADTSTGKLYVGSATGDDGLWGRWSSYGHTGDGGNKKLTELLEKDPDHRKYFQYSILKVFPMNQDDGEVLDFEKIYKQKLLSREFGLNDN